MEYIIAQDTKIHIVTQEHITQKKAKTYKQYKKEGMLWTKAAAEKGQLQAFQQTVIRKYIIQTYSWF